MHTLSVKQMSEKLKNREISSVELTQHYINRIEEIDPLLNSYITLVPESALKTANIADSILAKKESNPLTGIPIAHKDIFCTSGIKTTCGSKMLGNFIANYDATVVQKLKNMALPILGKTNMDEFAMGSSTESSYYGKTKNPWNLKSVPGGSSGGSAAAVSAGLAPWATGTDTGGSIRQPASFCGITGIKPTYGSISRYGMIAYASSFDQAGPMTKTAQDAAWLLTAMSGFDELDSTSYKRKAEDYSANLNNSIKGLKIGIPKEYFSAGLDVEVSNTIRIAIKELESLGAEIIAISLPNKDLAVPCYYVLAPAEASSNLSRFDGVRYGYRSDSYKDLNDLYTRSRTEGFGEEVKRRIMVGAYALSAGYYDAYYIKAQKIRRIVQQDFINAFKQCDVIVGPVSPTPAFNLGEKISDPISMYLADIYTIPVNLAGLPAMSVPAGFVKGMPVGMHLIGNYFSESKLLNVAHQYQNITSWHTQTPKIINPNKGE